MVAALSRSALGLALEGTGGHYFHENYVTKQLDGPCIHTLVPITLNLILLEVSERARR